MPKSLTTPLTGQICWYFGAAPPVAAPQAALVVASLAGRPVSLTASAMTWANGVVTATVPAQPDAIGSSYPITVAGVTPAGYNGSYQGTFASPTTITYPLATNPGAVTVQGTVAFASVFPAAGGLPPLGWFNLAIFDPSTGAITAAPSMPFYYGTRPASGAWCTMMRVNEPKAGSWPTNVSTLDFVEHGLTQQQRDAAAQARIAQQQAQAGQHVNGNPHSAAVPEEEDEEPEAPHRRASREPPHRGGAHRR